MTADANTKSEIVVDMCIPKVQPIRVSSRDAFLVDDLTQRACELVGVPPTFRLAEKSTASFLI